MRGPLTADATDCALRGRIIGCGCDSVDCACSLALSLEIGGKGRGVAQGRPDPRVRVSKPICAAGTQSRLPAVARMDGFDYLSLRNHGGWLRARRSGPSFRPAAVWLRCAARPPADRAASVRVASAGRAGSGPLSAVYFGGAMSLAVEPWGGWVGEGGAPPRLGRVYFDGGRTTDYHPLAAGSPRLSRGGDTQSATVAYPPLSFIPPATARHHAFYFSSNFPLFSHN